MSVLLPEYRKGSLVLPKLGLWLDPHEPHAGPEAVFVSHAHSDHIAAHHEVIVSAPTAMLMRARVPGERKEIVLPYGQTHSCNVRGVPFTITLLPAGHILGSAMCYIEAMGESFLYTGDFKLRRGLSAEPCDPRHADYLVMETTFGRPQYVFPPTEEVLKGVVRFCREALDEDKTAVLLGYSLGKSQEILCSLSDAGLPLMLHGAIRKPTEIYQQFGACFPGFEPYEPGKARGKVLVCPPAVANSALLRNLGPSRTAVLTGWAVDPNCRFRYQCDAAFPLSDHADFPQLLDMVRRVGPKRVYTLHGFAADFAQTLRSEGFKAEALSEQEQFSLGLSIESAAPRRASQSAAVLRDAPGASDAGTSAPFAGFAETCGRIASDARKLEKARILAEYLKGLEISAVPLAATWFSGRPFAGVSGRVLHIGWAAIRDALCGSAGIAPHDFHQVYLKHSDLGETAFELLGSDKPGQRISILEVSRLFDQLEAARGPTLKAPLLAAALQRCSGLEAKFLIKIVTGDLRIGLKEGLLEDAVAQAFGQKADEVRKANLLLGNIGETAELAALGNLDKAVLTPSRPFKFMLASPEETAASAWDRVTDAQADHKSAAGETPQAPGLITAWIEDKFDGVRCQAHKVGDRVALYSRDLKEITTTFQDVAEAMKRSCQDFIMDGEIVAMRDGKVLPFSDLQRRLGRREPDLFMREEVPARFIAFDLLWSDGKSRLNEPLRTRRAVLEQVCGRASAIGMADVTLTHSPADIDSLFELARGRGNEGLMIKDPGSVYTPGRRGLGWLKLKKAIATLDCVVVGAEFGHGKRSKVLSDYTFAVRDERNGELKVIGKAYTGLTDVEIEQLTGRFLSIAVRQRGRFFEVRPEVVLEIAFDRLQPSKRHNSGLAMRFPRIVRIRTDKPLDEIDTLATARKLASVAEPNP